MLYPVRSISFAIGECGFVQAGLASEVDESSLAVEVATEGPGLASAGEVGLSSIQPTQCG